MRGDVDVSVVTAVHNRGVAARNVLRSLACQTLPPEAFEVVFVDDGSERPLAEELAAEMATLEPTFKLRVLRHDTARGVQEARNAGAAQADGNVLVFLDADCLAHPGLLQAHLDAHTGRQVAVCGYTSVRELTPASWRLLLGDDWDFGDPVGVADRMERTPLLHDPLCELLADPRPSDWAFFWTHNVSIPRWAFEQVGGFKSDFPAKGVEDIEMGYRLARAGLPTVFAPAAKAVHQPHDRLRGRDIVQDRHNEQILVDMYPTLEVEAVCSYDIVRSRELVPAIQRFARALDPATSDCARLEELPGVCARIATAGNVLVMGDPAGWPTGLRPPDAICFPVDTRERPEPGRETARLPLLGTRIPYPDDHFELGLVTDYWRSFPERTLSRILSELARTCRNVVLLSGVSAAPLQQADPALAAALDAYDHPYWEFTVRLRRELHEFEIVERERAGTTAAFDLCERLWETSDLRTAISAPPSRRPAQASA
ncbi:glycosyltransferase [Nonomuraea mesophila]|uniref:Glycosyltransferase n=1 Tax=Nonomuraea mesophila TaxID=2530382 RepID=A0A4R5EGX4_9ACTN|nr:glycosyltransferase [Nonomuraea mesophila]TDE33610.1 glycosyltransferase [Nonomuraea mesophila]